MRTKGSAKELERVRLIAARMFAQEKSTHEISTTLSVDDQTVRAWRRAWRKKGSAGLLARPHPGPPARLTPEEQQQLVRMLAKEPAAYGFAKHLWTTPLVAKLIAQTFGVQYHSDYVGTLLHALGFSCQKPMRRAKERDESRIEKWRQESWPELLKKKRRGTP
jgi:transposase